VCFDPALGNRSDEQSRGRLMQMLSNLSIFAGDGGLGEEGGVLRDGRGREEWLCRARRGGRLLRGRGRGYVAQRVVP